MIYRNLLTACAVVGMIAAAPVAMAQSTTNSGTTNTGTTLAGGKNGQQGQSMQKREGAAESSGAGMTKSDRMKSGESGSMSK